MNFLTTNYTNLHEMKKLELLIIILVSFIQSGFAEDGCDYLEVAEKIYNAPRWWTLDREDDQIRSELEAVINELLFLDFACLQQVVSKYYSDYLGKDEEAKLNSLATFHLIFYAFCNVDSTLWQEYRGPFNDTQLMSDSWNPGDPWLLEFKETGVKIIAYPSSYGGSFGNLEARWNIEAYFVEVYSEYGKRNYLPKIVS